MRRMEVAPKTPIETIRRELFGLNQAEFSEVAGVKQATVSRWEVGEFAPNLKRIMRIRAEALNRGLPWDDSIHFRMLCEPHADVAP